MRSIMSIDATEIIFSDSGITVRIGPPHTAEQMFRERGTDASARKIMVDTMGVSDNPQTRQRAGLIENEILLPCDFTPEERLYYEFMRLSSLTWLFRNNDGAFPLDSSINDATYNYMWSTMIDILYEFESAYATQRLGRFARIFPDMHLHFTPHGRQIRHYLHAMTHQSSYILRQLSSIQGYFYEILLQCGFEERVLDTTLRNNGMKTPTKTIEGLLEDQYFVDQGL